MDSLAGSVLMQDDGAPVVQFSWVGHLPWALYSPWLPAAVGVSTGKPASSSPEAVN